MPSSDKINIYYLASGNIAIPILEALRGAAFLHLCGIGSQHKEVRSQCGATRTAKTPIVRYCESNDIAIDRIASVNTEEFRAHLVSLGVQMLIVASFGQLLKPALLALPALGCLNVHASLLPRYRGASPIVAALLNNDPTTGVSFMKMEAGLDTGPVYKTCTLNILPDDNACTLEQRLGVLAAQNIQGVITGIARRELLPVPQTADDASYAKKINKEDGLANWGKGAAELAAMVRAYTPWPSLRARMPARNGKSKIVKITKAVAIDSVPTGSLPGDILAYGREGILVACGSGALRILRLTPEGRKEMSAADYLLGSPIPTDHLHVCDFSAGD